MTTPTRKQVNDVLVGKKGGAHEDKRRRAENEEARRKVRELIETLREKRRGKTEG